MNRIVFVFLLLVSLGAYSQPSNYTWYKQRTRQYSFMADSAMYLPRYNGTPSGVRVGESSTISGMVGIDTTNHRQYFRSGGNWIRLAKYTELGIDSIWREAGKDTIFYSKFGTTYAIKDSTGGGSTPTLQQVLTAGSTLTTSNTINAGGNNFTLFNAAQLELAAQSGGNVVLAGVDGSDLLIGPTININPRLGELFIDSLDAFSDTTNFKPLVYRSSTGKVERATYWPVGSGGGGSPAGNFGNLQINRNGALATPGSDSLDYEASTGLEIKNTITIRENTDNNPYFMVKDLGGTIRWQTYIDGNNAPVFYGPPYWRFNDGSNEYFRIEGNDASSTSASVQVKTVVSGKAGVRVDLAGSATNDALQVYNSGANKIFNVTSEGGIDLYNYGTAPTASVTNGIRLYAEDVSSSAELKVRDEAGNITTLSPHNFSKIPGGKSEEMAWAFYSEKDGQYINVDMLKLARLVEKLTGEKLVFIGKK